jgi:hypothetical protein
MNLPTINKPPNPAAQHGQDNPPTINKINDVAIP